MNDPGYPPGFGPFNDYGTRIFDEDPVEPNPDNCYPYNK